MVRKKRTLLARMKRVKKPRLYIVPAGVKVPKRLSRYKR